MIDPFLIPLVIVGTKYDIFQVCEELVTKTGTYLVNA